MSVWQLTMNAIKNEGMNTLVHCENNLKINFHSEVQFTQFDLSVEKTGINIPTKKNVLKCPSAQKHYPCCTSHPWEKVPQMRMLVFHKDKNISWHISVNSERTFRERKNKYCLHFVMTISHHACKQIKAVKRNGKWKGRNSSYIILFTTTWLRIL